MLISTTTGFENFQSGSTKSYVFLVPTRAHQLLNKEVHLFIAARAGVTSPSAIRAVGSPASVPAAPGHIAETGKWTTATYDIPEGSVLKVFCNRSNGFGSMRVSANMLLRVRRNAALLRIGTILTGYPKATFTRVWTEGRFDIVSPAEAHLLGVNIPPQYLGSYSESSVSRAFEVITVDREISSASTTTVQVLENSSGEQVEVTGLRKTRALDL